MINIIYTPLCTVQQIYYIHNVVRYNLFIGVDKMRIKNITITVSVRVSVTVRVSLVLFVSSNTFGASSVAICRRCVYKIFDAYAQRCLIRCVYNKSVAFYTRLCI